MSVDLLAQAMNAIKTNENVGNSSCTVKASKLIKRVLNILREQEYLGEIEFVDDGRSGMLKVQLLGRINKCGVIKPRFPVKKNEWNQWEQVYIPGIGFGLLVVSTPKGLMTNEQAKESGLGGRLIAYIY